MTMRLDHLAHRVQDPTKTHAFYAGVLGLKLTQAYEGEELLLVYELPGGGSVAFSTGNSRILAYEAEWEAEHVGLTVSSREEFENWLQQLRNAGVALRLVEDERIYFADPDGLVLEIEVESPNGEDPQAEKKLERWVMQRR